MRMYTIIPYTTYGNNLREVRTELNKVVLMLCSDTQQMALWVG